MAAPAAQASAAIVELPAALQPPGNGGGGGGRGGGGIGTNGVLVAQLTLPKGAGLRVEANLQGRASGAGNRYEGKDWQERGACVTSDTKTLPCPKGDTPGGGGLIG